METIILSMLFLGDMTIYDMRAYIKRNLSAVCSDSLGSIQAGLKKLLDKGYISSNEYQEKNKTKKKYFITEEGIAFYTEWIGTTINISKMKSMEEGKIFFLGMASKEKRISFLKEYIDDLSGEYNKLITIKETIAALKEEAIEKSIYLLNSDTAVAKRLLDISTEENISNTVINIYKYQNHLLEYGLSKIKNDIDFYKNILDSELLDMSHEK